jgi:hypothetical protein
VSELFGEIDPPQRLLMGPGPVNAHPRVLRAMSADLLGQFDPEMTAYMNEVMQLYRPIFGTQNRWTFLIDGTARAAIEAALVSLVAPGDRVLVVNFGRFGLLLREILERVGAVIETVDAPWGEVGPLAPSGTRWPASSRSSWRRFTATPRPQWRSRSTVSETCAASSARYPMSTQPRRSPAWRSRPIAGASTS